MRKYATTALAAAVVAAAIAGCAPTDQQLTNVARQDRIAELDYERVANDPNSTAFQRFRARLTRPMVPPPEKCLAEGTDRDYECRRAAAEAIAGAQANTASIVGWTAFWYDFDRGL